MSHGLEWTEQKVRELIVLYEERPCLYNTKSKEYHNRDLRNKSYEEIASQLGITGNSTSLHSFPINQLGNEAIEYVSLLK